MERQQNVFKTHPWIIPLAVAQGVLLWLWENSYRAFESKPLAEAFERYFPLPIVFFIPIIAYFLVDTSKKWFIYCVSGCFIVLALLFLYQLWATPMFGAEYNVLLTAALSIPLFLVLPFLQLTEQSTWWKLDYGDYLRQFCRNTMLILQTGVVFLTIALTLALCALLFSLINIDFFTLFFADPRFIFVASSTLAAIALTAEQAKERLDTLASWLLTLSSLLLPIVSAAIALFIISLPFQGIEGLEAMQKNTSVLLSSCVLMLALINADWLKKRSRSPAAGTHPLILGITCLLPILVGIALYSTVLRMMDRDLLGPLITATAHIAIAAVYTLTYTGLILSGRWSCCFGRANMALVVFMIVIITSLLTPILDPRRIVAWSHMNKISELTRPLNSEDLLYIRVKLGRYGELSLKTLATDPKYAALSKEINQLLNTPLDQLAYDSDEASKPVSLEQKQAQLSQYPVYPDGQTLDPTLLPFLAEHWDDLPYTFKRDGAFLVVDLTRDGNPEAILVSIPESSGTDRSWSEAIVYERKNGQWVASATIDLDQAIQALETKLKSNAYTVVPPEPAYWSNLKIEDIVIKVKPKTQN